MAKCPHCEEEVTLDNLEADVQNMGAESPGLLSAHGGSQVKLSMLYCPHCEKVLQFLYG